jgi:hypothetical protein
MHDAVVIDRDFDVTVVVPLARRGIQSGERSGFAVRICSLPLDD